MTNHRALISALLCLAALPALAQEASTSTPRGDRLSAPGQAARIAQAGRDPKPTSNPGTLISRPPPGASPPAGSAAVAPAQVASLSGPVITLSASEVINFIAQMKGRDGAHMYVKGPDGTISPLVDDGAATVINELSAKLREAVQSAGLSPPASAPAPASP